MFIQNGKIRLQSFVLFIGLFQQQLASHLNAKKPQGCRQCGIEKRAKNSMILYTVEDIRLKCSDVFMGHYHYPDQEPVTSKQKISIECPKHGLFYQVLADHLKGHRCNSCSYEERALQRVKTLEVFIQDAEEIHPNKYDYSDFVYKNNKTSGIVNCRTCMNSFKIRPDQLLFKRLGCPVCNFNIVSNNIYSKAIKQGIHYDDYPCKLYVVELFNSEESFIKVGVTTNTVISRFKDCPYTVRSIDEKELTLTKALEFEKILKNKFKSFKHDPKIMFNGYTECFSFDVLEDILSCPPG